MKKNILNIFSIISISLLIMTNVQAQDWKIDDELKDTKLQISFDEANIAAGKEIYEKSACMGCHKDIVVADINDRVLPTAPNLGGQDIHKNNTDGELFCKIKYGNIAKGMPGFENSLSEEKIWQVIAYLRSYCNTYEAPGNEAVVAAPVENFDGTIKSLNVSFDEASNSIIAKVDAIDSEGNAVTPKGIKITMFVKRYFGDYKLCDANKTDDKGLVTIALDKLPADTTGYITITSFIGDGSFKSDTKMKISDGWVWVNPLDERHLWGTNDKTPLYLLITYLSVTIGVLSIIGWAAFQLLRIYNLRER